jgi:hypothetical protein
MNPKSPRRATSRPSHPRNFNLDALEPRLLLSASPISVAAPSLHTAQTTMPLVSGAKALTSVQPADITSVTWTGGTTGDWGTASNWSDNAIPNSDNDVIIPAGSTVTISSGAQTANRVQAAGSLSINGGSLTLATDSSVSGSFTLGNGATLTTNGVFTAGGTSALGNFATLTGSGSFVNNGTLTISNNLNLSANFQNNGTVNLTDSALDFENNITFTNASNATLNIAGNAAINYSGTLSNAGLVTSTSGLTSYSSINSPFDNTGTLHVTGGTLTLLTGTSSGTFNVDAGAALDFNAGPDGSNYTFTAGAQWNGSGLYEITNFMTVTITDPTVALTVQNLSISGYTTFSIAGSVTIPNGGNLTWLGGSVTGVGSLTIDSGATFSATNVTNALNTASFDNYGLATLTNSSFVFYNNATLTNESNATFNFDTAGSFYGTGTFVNAGTLNASQTSGTLEFAVPLNNASSGSVNVTTGTLVLGGGGTSSGPWDVSSGATLNFTAGYTFNTGSAWDGSGIYTITSSYYTAPVVVSAGLTLTPTTLQMAVNESNLEIDGAITIPAGGDFLVGYDNNFTRISGTGTLTISAGATMHIGDGQGWLYISGITINNYGNMYFDADSTFSSVNLGLDTNAVLFNFANIYIQNNGGTPAAAITIGDLAYLDNLPGGVITMSASGALTLQLQLNNDGTFNVTNGSVSVNFDGHSAGISDGVFNVSAGSTFTFAVSQTLNAGAQLDGAGTYVVGFGAVLTLNDPTLDLSPSNFSLSGTLTGSGSFTVTPSMTFAWDGGTISLTGGFYVQQGVTLTLTNPNSGYGGYYIDGGILDNSGIINLEAGLTFNDSATLQNETTGVINVTNNGFGTVVTGDASATTFNNYGTLTLTDTGTGIASVYLQFGELNNTGTIEVLGGRAEFESTAAQLAQVSADATTLTGGTWIVRNGSSLSLYGVDNGSNFSSTLTTNDATVILDGAGSNFVSGDQFTTNNGTLELINGAALTLSSLTNTGTLELGSGSALKVSGAFTQTSAGTLIDVLEGSASSGDYGALAVSGESTLAGTLHVSVQGFTPSIGDVYTLLTYGSRSGNFTTLQGVQPTFYPTELATSYTITGQNTDVPDLTATSVSGPVSATSGQKMTVTYAVTNAGEAAASGSWTDAIYLSPGTTFDAATAVLLGFATHTNGLGIGDSYQGSLTATTPALSPGNYSVFLVTDSGGVVSDSNRADNQVASTSTVAVSAPALTVGTPLTGSIANGQQELYALNLSGNTQVQLSLATAVAAGAEIYVSFGSAPTPSVFDQTAFNVSGDNDTLTINATQPGTYYILVLGREASGTGAGFTLTAQVPAFGITGYTPSAGSGVTTITIHGSGFASNDTVSLIPNAGGTGLVPTSFYFTNSSTISATFDLTGVATGNVFDLQVANGTQTSTVPSAFTVGQQTASAQPVVVTITAPQYVRAGVGYTIQVNYLNSGSQDAEAPLITLSVTNALLKLTESNVYASGTIAFLGINTGGGPAGILPAGYQGSITVQVEPTVTAAHTVYNYSYTVADPSQPMDYSALEPYLQASQYSPQLWSEIWANLQQRLGTTQAGYLAALSQDASILPASMGYADNPLEVMQIEVLKSLAAVTNSISGTITSTSPGFQVGGLVLDAYNSNGTDSFGAVVLNNGAFYLGNLTPGDYTFSLPGALLATANPVPVGSGAQVTGIHLSASQGAALTGTVTKASNSAVISGAQIEVIGGDGTQYFATSAANGTYSITGLPADIYSIIVTATGYSQYLQENVTLTTGGVIVNPALTVPSSISGTVTPTTGTLGDTPLITAQAPGNTDPNQVYSVQAAANGTFSLANLPAGTYDVAITLSGYLETQISNISVAAGAQDKLGTITLAAPATVSGNVASNDSDLPANGLPIGIYQGSQLVASTAANSSGNYTFTGLAAGTYDIHPINSTVVAVDIPITLTAGQSLTNQDLLVQPGGAISGTTLDLSTQNPIAGLTVIAKDSLGNLYSAITNSSGAYSFSHLVPGTYLVFLQGIANQSQSVTVTDPTGATSATANFSFQNNYTTTLSGQLQDGGGNPITGAEVLLEQNNQIIAQSIVDQNGNYSFLLDQGGTYNLFVVSANGSFTPVAGLVLTTGGSLTQNLVAGSSTLKITAGDASETPVGDTATLYLETASGPVLAGVAQIGSDSTVTFSNLINGTYEAVVQSDATVGQASVAVNGATQSNITLTAGLTLQGNVNSSGSVNTVGATVTLLSTTTGLTYSATTDSSGNYSFTLLPSDTYNVVVLANNFQANVSTGATLSANTTTNVTLTPSDRTLTGTVVDQGSNPIEGGYVTATDSSGDILGRAALNNDGTFSINTLTNVAVTLTFSANGYIPQQFQNVTLTSGETDALGSLTLTSVALSQSNASITSETALSLKPDANPPGLLPLTAPTVQQGPQAYLTTILQTIQDYLNVFLNDNLSLGPSDGCPECAAAYAQAQAAVTAFNNFRTNKMIPATGALLGVTAGYLGVVAAETASLAANLYLVAISVPALIDAVAAGATVGVGGAAASTYLSWIQAAPVINNLIGSIASEASQIQSLQSASSIQAAVSDIGQLGFSLYKQFSAGKSILSVAPGGPPLIPPLLSACISGALAIYNSYSITKEYFPKFEQLYQAFYKGYAVYNNLKNAAINAINAYNNCAAANSQGCGNHGGGGGKGGGSTGGKGGGIGGGTTGLNGHDPNDLYGPSGYGPKGFVTASQPLGYTIDFENSPTASAATSVVTITQTLDPNLNLATFSLGNFGFGVQTIIVPAGLTTYSTVVDDTANSGYDVAVTASLNVGTRTVSWTFTTLDPTTGQPPANSLDGFLPPDVNGSGDGFVSYTVSPGSGLATGTVIQAQASVVFDNNPAMLTQAVSNTIDAVAPSSSVDVLPSKEAPQFTLQWGGTDDFNGSGLADYNIYYSQNGGAWTPFLLDTTKTAALFNGIVGDTYSFYSVAQDNAGNIQLAPLNPNATTTIAQPTLDTIKSGHAFSFTDGAGNLVTIKLSGPGTAVAILEGGIANDADLRTLTLSGTTVSSALSVTVSKVHGSSGETVVDQILTGSANESIGSITLGAGVSLGSGLDDGSMALDLSGGVKSLSLGGLNEDAQIVTTGSIGLLTIGDLNQAGTAAAVDNATVDALSIGNISVKFVGTPATTTETAIFDSTFTTTDGNIGNIAVSLVPGTATTSLTGISDSTFTATNGKIGNIAVSAATGADTQFLVGITGSTFDATHGGIGTVGTSIKSGASGLELIGIANSIFTAALGSIGNLSAAESSGTKTNSIASITDSTFSATANIGNITATAVSSSPTAILTGIAASSFTADGSIGSVNAAATSTAAKPTTSSTAAISDGDGSVDFSAGTSIGAVRATAAGAGTTNVALNGSSNAAIDFAAGTSIGAFTVIVNKSNTTGSSAYAADDIDIRAGTTIATIAISGKATKTQATNFNVTAGGSIAGIHITASGIPADGSLADSIILAGDNTALTSNASLAKAGIGHITLSGSLIGSTASPDSIIAAVGNIGAVSIGGSMTNESLVAGFNSGSDSYNSNSSIASVTVAGMFDTSSINAGINPGSDLYWGGATDASGTPEHGVTQRSHIGTIKLGATTVSSAVTNPFSTPATNIEQYAIESLTLSSVQVGHLKALTSFIASHYINPTGGAETSTDTSIREVTA